MNNQAAQTMPAFEFTIPGLIKHWREQAEECRAMADRIGVNGPAYNELLRDASQYIQSAYQLEHIAALSQPAGVDSYAKGVEAAAAWLDGVRNEFCEEHSRIESDTNALTFGRGKHAEAKEEYVSTLEELAAGIRAMLAAAPAASGGETDHD